MTEHQIAVGDLVVNTRDPRHVGKVQMIVYSNHTDKVVVLWEDTGWTSTERLDELEHANETQLGGS